MSVRNLAVSGKSDKMKKDAIAQRTVKSPSRIKIHAQPGLPPTPSILARAAARSPLNAPAIVAEEKNTPTRVPSSLRRYQLKESVRSRRWRHLITQFKLTTTCKTQRLGISRLLLAQVGTANLGRDQSTTQRVGTGNGRTHETSIVCDDAVQCL